MGETRLAAYAYSITEGALLLTQVAPHEQDAGSWTLPGGGLNWGESPEAGMIRELREETGLSGTILGLLGIDSLVLNRRPSLPALHSVRIVYRVACSGEPQVMEKGGSVVAVRWVPLDQLASLPLVDLVTFAQQQAGDR